MYLLHFREPFQAKTFPFKKNKKKNSENGFREAIMLIRYI